MCGRFGCSIGFWFVRPFGWNRQVFVVRLCGSKHLASSFDGAACGWLRRARGLHDASRKETDQRLISFDRSNDGGSKVLRISFSVRAAVLSYDWKCGASTNGVVYRRLDVEAAQWSRWSVDRGASRSRPRQVCSVVSSHEWSVGRSVLLMWSRIENRRS